MISATDVDGDGHIKYENFVWMIMVKRIDTQDSVKNFISIVRNVNSNPNVNLGLSEHNNFHKPYLKKL